MLEHLLVAQPVVSEHVLVLLSPHRHWESIKQARYYAQYHVWVVRWICRPEFLNQARHYVLFFATTRLDDEGC